MRKGDMILKILEAGKFRDVKINEGDVSQWKDLNIAQKFFVVLKQIVVESCRKLNYKNALWSISNLFKILKPFLQAECWIPIWIIICVFRIYCELWVLNFLHYGETGDIDT